MGNTRFWIVFALLCLLSAGGVTWLRGGTEATPIAFLLRLADACQQLLTGKDSSPASETTRAGNTEKAGTAADSTLAQHPTPVADISVSGHTAKDHQTCLRPQTRSRHDTGTSLVYKWIDQDGQTHMADTPPTGQIASVIDMAGSRRDFTYEIEADGITLPLDFQGQIAAGSKRIYDTWHFFLGAERLRQSRIKLRVIGGPDRYDAFRKKAWPNGKPSNGFYSPAKNEAYVKYNARNTDQVLATSFHEISHLITASHLGVTPPWLTEGLAEYFETMEVSSQTGTLYPNRAHISLLRNSPLPRLPDFLAVDRTEWNGELRSLNYAMAWSLIHFLMQGAPGIYAVQEVIQQAHAHFCQPFSVLTSLNSAYPGGIQRLEVDWKKWLASDSFNARQI